ncbi:MAG: TraR/DksA family transcriptional regulator [Chlamydiota bacterium]|jgi:DnaK suppressor protein
MKLTKKEAEAIRRKLLELRAKILGQFKEAVDVVKEPDESKGYSQHQADEGTDDFEKNLNLQLSSQEERTIRYIDRALEKLEEGTYGICDVTEKPISKKRLEVIPYATMTVEAQQEMEKKL